MQIVRGLLIGLVILIISSVLGSFILGLSTGLTGDYTLAYIIGGLALAIVIGRAIYINEYKSKKNQDGRAKQKVK